MKKSIIAIALLVAGTTTFGQIDGSEKDLKTAAKGSTDSTKVWATGGNLNINATQVALSNWAGGGQNSVSLQGLLGGFANYSKGKAAWDNSLDLAYGMIKTGRADWFKNDDRIELNSKFGYKASDHWYYAALLNFRTQFADGYGNVGDENPISKLFAPAYTTIAIGMDYKPNAKFNVFISPATMKITMVMDDSLASIGAFGVEAGQNVRSEFGGYLKASFVEPKVFGNENLGFKTSLSLFSNYMDRPQNIDVNWDAVLTAKVAKYFTVSLSVNMIYDHDINIQRYDDNGVALYKVRPDGSQYTDADGSPILYQGPATQFKEVLALGFAYKF